MFIYAFRLSLILGYANIINLFNFIDIKTKILTTVIIFFILAIIFHLLPLEKGELEGDGKHELDEG